MEIFPAIDLLGGQVVRLHQGDYNRVTVYGSDPAAVARDFKNQGARNLHVVDLDGARDGDSRNYTVLREICRIEGLSVQTGGGIRTEERIEEYLALGVDRVILGTAAVRDMGFVRRMTARFGAHIAVGADARDGCVAISGWQETTAINALDFCQQLCEAGVQTVIYTDIATDGALAGTNLDAFAALRSACPSLNIIASGGVSFARDITELQKIGVYGAIIGKALYENKLTLAQALALAAGKETAI